MVTLGQSRSTPRYRPDRKVCVGSPKVVHENNQSSPSPNNHRPETAMMTIRVEWTGKLWCIHRARHTSENE